MDYGDCHGSSAMDCDEGDCWYSDVQTVLEYGESCAKENVEEKIEKIRSHLEALRQSFSEASLELDSHSEEVFRAVLSWHTTLEKKLEANYTYMKNILMQECSDLESLKKQLTTGIISTQVCMAASTSHSGLDVKRRSSPVDKVINLMSVLQEVKEKEVKPLPPLKFYANEKSFDEVFKKQNYEYLGSVIRGVLPTALRLVMVKGVNSNEFIYNIIMPKDAEQSEISKNIKCILLHLGQDLHQDQEVVPFELTPKWTSNHLQVRFACMLTDGHSLSVTLHNQHISGSPTVYTPKHSVMCKPAKIPEDSAFLRGTGLKEGYEGDLRGDEEEQGDEENEDDTSAVPPLSFILPSQLKSQPLTSQNDGSQCKVHDMDVPACASKDNPSVAKHIVRKMKGPAVPMRRPANIQFEEVVSPRLDVVSENEPHQIGIEALHEDAKTWDRVPHCAQVGDQHIHVETAQPMPARAVDTMEEGTQSTHIVDQKMCCPNSHISHVHRKDICRSFVKHLVPAKEGLQWVLGRLQKIHSHADSDADTDSCIKYNPGYVLPTRGSHHLTEATYCKTEATMMFRIHGNKLDFLDRPIGVAVLHHGEIVVTDTFNDRMGLFSSEGVFIKFFTSPGGLRRPSAVAQLKNGDIAVKDSFCITLFDSEGNYLRNFGKDILRKPFGLVVTACGQLMTLNDECRGVLTLIILCPKEEYLVARISVNLNLRPEDVPQSKPRYITSCGDNKVLVADIGLSCIYEVDLVGRRVLDMFGGRGVRCGQFNQPLGIACDADGYIFVADGLNARIQVFDSQKKHQCILKVDVHLQRPSAICITPDDYLIVADFLDSSVIKYELNPLLKYSGLQYCPW